MRYVIVFTCLLLSACPVTEGDRRLIHQDRQASAAIQGMPGVSAAAVAAAHDIELNSTTLAANLGEPEVKTPYTPKNSADAREQAVREHAEPPGPVSWLSAIADHIVPGAGVVLLGAWGLVQSVARRRALSRLTAVYDGVEEVKGKIGDGKFADAITDTMRQVAGLHNVYRDIRTEITGLRKRGVV